MSKKRRNRLQRSHSEHRELTVRAEFRGPLPPPSTLERYAVIIPNGAERIMAMAEKQAIHRQGLESRTIDANIRAQARGQAYGLIIVLAGILVGTVLVAMGKKTEGLVSILGPLTVVAGIFVTGRWAQERERKEKLRRQNEEAKPDDGSN